MRKVKGSAYMVMGTMAVALIVIFSALGMDHWKSKLLPLVVSAFILFCGSMELRKGILQTVTPPKEGKKGEEGDSKRILHGYLVAGAWAGAFLAGIFLVGFLVAIPVFTFLYMKLHGAKWLGAIVLTVVLLGFMWGISEPLAGIQLYRGIIPTYIGDLISS